MDKEHNIPVELIVKDIKDILEVFKRHGVKAYLAYGAVLGIARSGKLIPWDDDIDLDVIDEIDLKTRKAIGWALYDLGFQPQPISVNVFGRMEPLEYGYNGDETSGIIVCERNFKFSIFFYRKEGDDFVCIPKVGALKLISVPTRFHAKHDSVKLKGEKFETPGPLKDYLKHVYGSDWKTPIRDLHAPNCIADKQKRE